MSTFNKFPLAAFDTILARLPYRKPFLFVDELTAINENGVEGWYTFPVDAYYYEGHFPDNPVTPGVILTEVMAQIGVVCLGIYLLDSSVVGAQSIALTATQIDFYKTVFPGETVLVRSTKEYFRFHKLKCQVEMLNSSDELVCRGSIAGMMKAQSHA